MLISNNYLIAVQGWLCPKLAHEITWNRTVNLHGGAGHNIAKDLANEFLNNEFKGHYK